MIKINIHTLKQDVIVEVNEISIDEIYKAVREAGYYEIVAFECAMTVMKFGGYDVI